MATKDGARQQVAVMVWVLAAIVAVVIAACIGYGVGLDAGGGSINCDEGQIVSLQVTGADEFGNGDRVLSIGDCDRVDEAALVAAFKALELPPAPPTTAPTTETSAPADGAPTTTTTTSVP